MMSHYRWLPLLAMGLILGGSPGGEALADDPVRLNQVQVIGSHNSYHVAPAPPVLNLIGLSGKGRSEALDYTHRPLGEQFGRLGIRQIELDVFADPVGGRYAAPAARSILRSQGLDPGPDPNLGGVMGRPGLKVLHIPDIDYRSTAPTFLDALGQVRAWSDAHPRHVPILVLVELKDEPMAALPTRPVKFGKAELDSVDAAVLATFDRSRVLTPDDVRGESATIPEALRSRGWPTLDSARGKILFALDNEGAIRDLYLEGHPALQGRALFASVAPDHPAAAFLKINDAVADFDRIRSMVRAGFLVRTRADIDTRQARADDPSRRDKALASGAQFVSTDYPEPRPEFSPYVVRFPAGVVARPNPINGPQSAPDTDLERESR